MARCTSPFSVKAKDGTGTVPQPCGKCPNCIARRVSQWSQRLVQQDRDSEQAWFITLTYDNENVPLTKKKFMTVCKKDVQDFFKRLRYYSPKLPKIKYYAAAEYGSDTKRPHYHVILFNAHPDSVLLAWGMGSVYFGSVTAASVGYSLKYISKKGQIPMHANDDRVPEFALMSKGLGKGYLTEEAIQWHYADMMNRMYIPMIGGKKVAMARYYKDKIYTPEQREHIGAYISGKMLDEENKKIAQYEGDYYRDKHEREKWQLQRKGYLANFNDKL